MPNYKVVVELTARVEYEVEVVARSRREAEEKAMQSENVPQEYQTGLLSQHVVQWEAEAERTSWECEECGTEIAEDEYRNNDEMCVECGQKADRSISAAKFGNAN